MEPLIPKKAKKTKSLISNGQVASSSVVRPRTAQITQADIALRLGIDQSTVSACLTNAPRATKFKPELRARILREAEAMNYRPHFFATQLRNTKPKVLVLAIGTLLDAHAAIIAEAFTRKVESQGYRVIISVLDMASGPSALDDIIGPQGVHALCLLTSACDLIGKQQLERMLEEGIRVCMISRSHPDRRVMEVRIDEAGSGRLAYQYLYDTGHRNVWILSGVGANPVAVGARGPAAVELAQELGAPEPLHFQLRSADDHETDAGTIEVMNLIKHHGLPEAVFAVRDTIAYGVVQALHKLGVKVGEDVSVIGHDDIWPSRLYSPALTTIRQPMRRMGSSAAMLLIDAMDEAPTEKILLQFQSELIIRDSVLATFGAHSLHNLPT